MTDRYPAAKELSDYVDRVIAHLALTMGIEPAALRVLEHLRIVLEAGMNGTASEDIAFALMEPAHTV